MSLNESYDEVLIPKIHYVYLEKIGPFMETAMPAWQEVLSHADALAGCGSKQFAMSLYNVDTQTYRAGFTYDHKPGEIPTGLTYELFEGGNYICFLLNGSYGQLPQACGRVAKIVEEQGVLFERNRFSIEKYLNDPTQTPENELLTEILVPVKN